MFIASRESRKSSGGTSIASSVSPRNPAIANLVADASSRLKKHAQKNNLRLQIPDTKGWSIIMTHSKT